MRKHIALPFRLPGHIQATPAPADRMLHMLSRLGETDYETPALLSVGKYTQARQLLHIIERLPLVLVSKMFPLE